jgi:hypothetical protein
MTWRSFVAGEGAAADDQDVLYWYAREPGGGEVERALETWERDVRSVYSEGVRTFRVYPPATSEEIGEWTRAAKAYLDEVAAAMGELRSAQERLRQRLWWPARLWAKARYRDAAAVWRDRVSGATSAYRPVREVIDGRLAEQEAARAEAARRKQQEQERRQRDAEARFQTWQRRQAVADRPLPGGITPRQMAARGDSPTSWPAEVEATVGDVAVWWAGVRASVRNEQARAEAVLAVTEAIIATAAALEKSRRPGLSAASEGPREVLHGWWVDFTWSQLPGVEQLRTPPDIPVGHLPIGEWDYDLYLPRRILFTCPNARSVSPGDYKFATVTNERVGNSHYTRFAWWKRNIAEFAEDLFPVWITYRMTFPGYTEVRTRITDHAEPATFIPYVHAVAQRAVATFQALVPDPR